MKYSDKAYQKLLNYLNKGAESEKGTTFTQKQCISAAEILKAAFAALPWEDITPETRWDVSVQYLCAKHVTGEGWVYTHIIYDPFQHMWVRKGRIDKIFEDQLNELFTRRLAIISPQNGG